MPNISKAQELRKQNAGLHAQMCALNKKAVDEKRNLTAEELAEWNRMDQEYEARKAEIERNEKLETREAELATLDPRRAGREGTGGNGDGPETRDNQSKALRAFIAQSPATWDQDTRELIQRSQASAPPEARNMGHCFVLTGKRDFEAARRLSLERRFLGVDTATKGQETVPQDFMTELDVAMKDFSGILQVARVITTDTGATMPWPTANDTGSIGELLATEDTSATEADPAFAAVTFGAYIYSSKAARVANALLQDSAFNLEGELASMLGIRLGRIMNLHGTKGTGTGQPRGVVTAVLAATTPPLAASATAISYLDLVNLQHAVNPAYRDRPKVAWMMHDSILKALKKLLDGESRPLWSSGMSAREPDTILGKPFFINQDMDSAIVEDAESVLFGDFSKYIIRRVINPVLVRLNELYALKYQTAFVMFDRWDSDLVDAGGGPIQVLSHNLA